MTDTRTPPQIKTTNKFTANDFEIVAATSQNKTEHKVTVQLPTAFRSILKNAPSQITDRLSNLFNAHTGARNTRILNEVGEGHSKIELIYTGDGALLKAIQTDIREKCATVANMTTDRVQETLQEQAKTLGMKLVPNG